MTLPRWNTYDETLTWWDDLDPIFEEGLVRALDGWPASDELGLDFPIDLFEDGDHLVTVANLPGLKFEEVNVEVQGYAMKIRGEVRDAFSTHSTTGATYFQERGVGEFQRSVALPVRVDPDSMALDYKDGVLKISVKKQFNSTR